MDRTEAINRIRKALKERTGRMWSVSGGRGTAWGWIEITAPPARRKRYEQSGREYVGSIIQDDDAALLGLALGLGQPSHPQGVSIPASSDYRQEYVDRAEGRKPSVIGRPYWD